MPSRGYDRHFVQIKGFGGYIFPESHAASFALLAYTSARPRRHEPAVVLAALLNSQSMGFYTSSQLIHGVPRRERPTLPPACKGSEIMSDYRAMGFTLGSPPLELLRKWL